MDGGWRGYGVAEMEAHVASEAQAGSGPRAGFGRRLVAAILDGVILMAVSMPFALVDIGAYYAVSTAIGILYFTLMEGGSRGQTVGKRAMGIRVIDSSHGGSIGYGRAFVRYIGRLLSSIVLFIGYLWMLWDEQKQTWHDKLASDLVVPVSAYPVD